MLNLEVLISKLRAVYRNTSRAIVVGKIATLEHEVWDYTVKDGTLKRQLLCFCALLACNQTPAEN